MNDQSTTGPSIVWLRDDLRLADNPALTAAVERGEPVVLVFILDDEGRNIRPHGGASRWWLHTSLEALGMSVAGLGGRLTLRKGAAEEVIPALVAETGAGAVFWNRRYGGAREVDAEIKRSLHESGVDAQSFQASLLFEPWTVTTGDGTPFRVFTPFWRAAREQDVRAPLPAPEKIAWAAADSDELDTWRLLPRPRSWAAGLQESWHPGEAGAQAQLESFITDRMENYHRRDEPKIETSQLSPHLRFGEISPFQVWDRVHGEMSAGARKNAAKFLSELGWREFNHNILFHFPDIAGSNYRPAFDAFPWAITDEELKEDADNPLRPAIAAWQEGRTGVPLVDAGMRQLWHTGYMHNRVRMVTASFLIKNLLVDWRVGEKWFWDTLVDADDANNPSNWQWVAGSGADAAPYFRVFNPVLQAEKFDPDGSYIRRWVPEIGTDDYPAPIVDLAVTRRAALAAYEEVRNAGVRQ